MASLSYVILVFCVFALDGINADDDCFDPDTQQSRFVCAVIDRDNLCQDGNVSDLTCQSCDSLKALCGLPTNETDFCYNFDEESIQYCPFTRAVNCTGDAEDWTDEQQIQCDHCWVVVEENCTAPPPGECYDSAIQVACNADEIPEGVYTCAELFPIERLSCQFCKYYELICGRPLGDLNTTVLCSLGDVAYCRVVTMREECVNMEEILDPNRALECAYCTIIVEANCPTSPPSTYEMCMETELELFCATVLREELCRGTMLDEESCETCLFFQQACGAPQGDITDLCDSSDATETCREAEPVCSMDEVPLENVTMCDGCDLREERCFGSGRSMWAVSLPVVVAALLVGWMLKE